jgi:hypothetical protein
MNVAFILLILFAVNFFRLELVHAGSQYQKQFMRLLLLATSLLIWPGLAIPQTGPAGVSDGLQIWLRADRGIAAADGEQVLLWTDQSGNGNDAYFESPNLWGESPPTYDKINAQLGGQSSVRFEGENGLRLASLTDRLVDYTIFVVSARDHAGVNNFYVGGGGPFAINLGYADDNILQLETAGIPADLHQIRGTIEPYQGTPKWSLDVYRHEVFPTGIFGLDDRQFFGGEIYRNGRLVTTAYTNLREFWQDHQAFGHSRDVFQDGRESWFRGDISELIVYDRALTFDEQSAVEAYLAQRHRLVLTPRKIVSPWIDTPPTIDGNPEDSAWQSAGNFEILEQLDRLGTVRFSNDNQNLYLLFDMEFDRFVGLDNLDTNYLVIHLDTNENRQIDESGDIAYYISSPPDGATPVLNGPIRPMGRDGTGFYALVVCNICPPYVSEVGTAFTASPWEGRDHVVRELRLSLDEILASPGETIRLGIFLESDEPSYFYRYPQNHWFDFERMIEVNLSPEPPLFSDGFESAQ